jgi:hypothetical protein
MNINNHNEPNLLGNMGSSSFEKFSDEWIVFEVKIKLRQFLIRFKSIANFYRLISQGAYRLGGVSNRTFFKSAFSNGFYRYSIERENINFIFVLKTKSIDKIGDTILQFKVRTRKLINCVVLSYSVDELVVTDKILLNHPKLNAFKMIMRFQ